jgi:pimeloyl-ACP methyl ester carboxylesterase
MVKPHGTLVKVKGRNMNVRQMGEGDKTIVLLPGWNVPLPSVEFAPLIRELSKKYKVCVIEYFGYGHSDSTDTPRTNENYTQEIRESLKLAGLNPPYVLMPYSCSGIYCEYYAAKYPNEVEGLILLDCTSSTEECPIPTKEEIDEVRNIYNSAIAGIESLDNEDFDPDVEFAELYTEYLPYGYTKEEIYETCTIPNHMDTLIAQIIDLSASVQEVMTMDVKLSKDIPILMLGGDTGYGCEDNELEKARKDHMKKLGGQVKLVIIEGASHGDIYFYREVIRKEIDEFLSNM